MRRTRAHDQPAEAPMTQPNARRLRTHAVGPMPPDGAGGGRPCRAAGRSVIAGHRGEHRAQSSPVGTPMQLPMASDEEDLFCGQRRQWA